MRISRREFLKFLFEGAFIVGFLRFLSLPKGRVKAEIVRPPGAVEEECFNQLCVRCGVCIEICPTGTIVPVGPGANVNAVNTPRIDPLSGPCEFVRGLCEDERLCCKFCPTGALRDVNKNEIKIGTVEFDSSLCLAFQGKECLVCYEMCPVPSAITVSEDLKPIFNGDLCVGCGTCVYHCPAEPKALILRSEGEKRAPCP